ncbi:MAG: 16S rRNA (guanine(966)-N(2))-methyltransferase RsmD [Acidobacteria bacterium]|nr:16S rRNA (guanine(966)-N(2))-methyltransferase RsmD [Acidobacteriota bacterium]
MRIIAGTQRGHKLDTLKGSKLRPTSEQMRETLFDVLGPSVRGATFMDAYAGSGAIGLEALSRGAGEVVFVEHHRAASKMIRKNLDALKIQGSFRLMTSKVLTAFEKLEDEGASFDFVFLDPPYDEISEYHHGLRQLGRSSLIRPSSLVIAEHSRHQILEERYAQLARVRTIRHGDVILTFYQLA